MPALTDQHPPAQASTSVGSVSSGRAASQHRSRARLKGIHQFEARSSNHDDSMTGYKPCLEACIGPFGIAVGGTHTRKPWML